MKFQGRADHTHADSTKCDGQALYRSSKTPWRTDSSTTRSDDAHQFREPHISVLFLREWCEQQNTLTFLDVPPEGKLLCDRCRRWH